MSTTNDSWLEFRSNRTDRSKIMPMYEKRASVLELIKGEEGPLTDAELLQNKTYIRSPGVTRARWFLSILPGLRAPEITVGSGTGPLVMTMYRDGPGRRQVYLDRVDVSTARSDMRKMAEDLPIERTFPSWPSTRTSSSEYSGISEMYLKAVEEKVLIDEEWFLKDSRWRRHPGFGPLSFKERLLFAPE